MRFSIDQHPTQETLFLEMQGDTNDWNSYRCIGCASLENGQWYVTVNAVYNPETDSDSQLIGYFDNQIDAQLALWQARQQAAACSGVYV